MTIGGEEYLFYKALPINVAFIRGTTADPDGNITMEREALVLENLAMALAAKNSHGYVICQVERIAAEGTLDSRQVRIPGVLVDAVVVAEPQHHMQTWGIAYNPALSGEVRIPTAMLPPLPLDDKKVIARRAAMELLPSSVVNLGIGIPDNVGRVANEERIYDLMTLTVDPGVMGGVPASGVGVRRRHQLPGRDRPLLAVRLHRRRRPRRGLPRASRSATAPAASTPAASATASRAAGASSTSARTARRSSSWATSPRAARSSRCGTEQLHIVKEGRVTKFVERVGQITFSGPHAAGQQARRPLRDRALRLPAHRRGLALVEVAPGIDLERDVLRHLPFRPIVERPAVMNAAIFLPAPMGLRDRLLDVNIDDRLSYDPATNTVFMNYSGMRVRREEDIATIIEAVDRLLGPLGKRVNSIVNYEGFTVDDDAMQAYMDAVKYVEQTYYLKVSRFTNSGYLRLKFAKELERRQLSSRVFETRHEADRAQGTLGQGPDGPR